MIHAIRGRRAVLAAASCAALLTLATAASAKELHLKSSDDLPDALWNLAAGDTVYLAAGDYHPSVQNAPYNHLLIDSKNGTPTTWTTIRAEPGARPRIVMNAMTGFTIKNSSFVRVEGLELVSDGVETQCEGGVQVIGSHDVQIVDNWVHDFAGSGIELFDSQILIEGNIVWHNAWRAFYGPSGISFFGGNLAASDNTHFAGALGNPGDHYEVIIRNNICFDNRQTNQTDGSPGNGTTEGVTDGSGIILDTLGNSPVRTLVANNVVFYNGGHGIHVFQSSNADVVFNTLYRNVQFLPAGNDAELTSFGSNNRYSNNVVYADNGRKVTEGAADLFTGNLFFNGGGSGNNLIGKDPLFASVPPANPANDAADAAIDVAALFRLQPGSPAVGAAQIFDGVDTDRAGTPRSTPYDLGAYEYVVGGGPSGAGVGGATAGTGSAAGSGGAAATGSAAGSGGAAATGSAAGSGGTTGSGGGAGASGDAGGCGCVMVGGDRAAWPLALVALLGFVGLRQGTRRRVSTWPRRPAA